MGTRESALQGAPVDGRRLGPRKSFSLTRGRRQRSLAPRVLRISGGSAGRDRRCQRPLIRLALGRKRLATAASPGMPDAPVPRGTRVRQDREVVPRGEEVEAGRASSNADQPGLDCRKVVRRRTGEPLGPNTRNGKHPAVDATKVACPEIERCIGCSYRKSVAEVGKRHLHRKGRGEPRGKPSSSGVARSGSRSLGGERRRGRARESVATHVTRASGDKGARSFART